MFPENLKYLRKKFGLEQIELANKLGRKSSSSVSEWEKGKYTPKIGILNDIAEIFNVKLTDLMNSDLSKNDSSLNIGASAINKGKSNILSLYNKLDSNRQSLVYNFAQKQLEDQNMTKNMKNFDQNKQEEIYTLAAHSDDPNKKVTEEDLDNINSYLDELDAEYDKKNKNK